MNNPINMLKSMINSKSPQDMVMNMIGNSNPMLSNLMDMAKSGNNKGVETFARNLCKSKNIDFDKQFADFMSQLKS